jgi:hypothetical protein
MFSRWIVTNVISRRGTLHCRKTRLRGSTRDLWTVVVSSPRTTYAAQFFCWFGEQSFQGPTWR